MFEEALPRLRAAGSAYQAPAADELVPARHVFGARSGKQLDPQQCAEGRRRELLAMEEQEALLAVPLGAVPRGARKARAKWVEDVRGDSVKSRFVATEVAHCVREDVYAGTTGRKAVRLLLSLAASRGWKVSVFDVVAAFIHAPIDELVVLLPPRGMLPEDSVFVLQKALYGTRRASRLWQRHYTQLLNDAGWKSSVIFPACFYKPDAGLLACHGGDVIAAAGDDELDGLDRAQSRYRSLLASALDVKRLGRVGPGAPGRVDFLKRAVCWDERRGVFTWAGNSKHVHDAAETLGLLGEVHNHPNKGARPCEGTATPGSQSDGSGIADAEQPLDAAERAKFMSAAGTLVYAALDRPDIQLSVKCVMADLMAPTRLSLVRLERIVKYLLLYDQLEWEFGPQPRGTAIDAYADADWAGDAPTRRSTTCVAEKIGRNVIETISSSQAVAALSSGEAEFYAATRAAAGGLQSRHFLLEVGEDARLRVWSDSFACRGIMMRTGTGRICHLEIKWTWVQEALNSRRLSLHRVAADVNEADIGTKYLDAERLAKLLGLMGLRRIRGPAAGLALAAAALPGAAAQAPNEVENG